VKVYYEQEIKQEWIQSKKVAVIGYGSQGFAHSNNLRHSGVDVAVALRKKSTSVKKAQEAGLKVMSNREASAWADVIMVLVPDHLQGEVYEKDIVPSLSAGMTLILRMHS
jgi:ketol-acid reductoisomerase